MLSTENSQPWQLSAGIAGTWAERTLTQSTPLLWDFRSVQAAYPFGFTWEAKPDSCCKSSDTPLFEESHPDDWSHCAAKCATKCQTDFQDQCGYIEVTRVGNLTFQCRAHGGICFASSCQGSARHGTKTLQRMSLNAGTDALHTGRCHAESSWRHQRWWNYSSAFERCGPSTVCVQGQGCKEVCAADEDCDGFPMRVCVDQGRARKCKHKNLFGQAAGRDTGAAVTFFVISGLALSAGIGGGGLYVPLLMVLEGFTAHEATGLSQALLAGGAASALIYNMRQRHPSGSKPMIDYNLVLVMGPNLLIGALIGSSLNMAAPAWLILLLATAILSQSAWKTLKKAVKTLRAEQAGDARGMSAGDGRLSKNVIERACNGLRERCLWHGRLEDDPEFSNIQPQPSHVTNAVSAGSAPPQFASGFEDELESEVLDVEAPRIGDVKDGQQSMPVVANATIATRSVSQEAPSDLKSQPQAQFPRAQLMQFAFMWLVTVLCIVARGGKASPGLASYCGQAYWLITLCTVAALAAMNFVGAQRAVQQAGDAPADNDGIQWTMAVAQRLAISSLVAGTLGALCGVGGGMVLGPILLDLGVLPQVQSASTAMTLLLLSSSSALAFLVQGAAPMDYAVFFAVFTASGAVIGKAVIGWLVKLYRRPSALIFLLGGIILASVLIMASTGTINVINDIRNGQGLGFKSICTVESNSL